MKTTVRRHPASHPSVAIVVAAHCAEQYLSATLASVAAQHDQPEQVVIVDDASTDGTLELCRQWQALLPLEIVEHPTNRGLAAARNSGVMAATTDYVTFLDADDIVDPDHIRVHRDLARSGADVVVTRAVDWHPDRNETTARSLWRTRRGYRRIRWHNDLFGASTFRRQTLIDCGGYRCGELVEDWDLWIRLRSVGIRPEFAKRATYRYRRHSTSLSQSANMAGRELATLERSLSEARTRRERRQSRRGLRWHRAARAFSAAQRAADEGNRRQAWRELARAMTGGSWRHLAVRARFGLRLLVRA